MDQLEIACKCKLALHRRRDGQAHQKPGGVALTSITVSMKTCCIVASLFAVSHAFTNKIRVRQRHAYCSLQRQLKSWGELEEYISSPHHEILVSVDSVLDLQDHIEFSSDHPTLFRERHGWCPYSERVWLAMEIANVTYDTIRIDNTGGPRPHYFSGQTPQVRWPEGKTQSESMDLVYEIDRRYANGIFQSQSMEVRELVSQFNSIFPRARPSSRAAFLFQMNGEPLWKSTFEATLEETDDLLSCSHGPFFHGSQVTAADIAWAPFLERYRYQLPCLHQGLDPANPVVYPHLKRWYDVMDKFPVYACRVKGDAASWRKVLTMAGFGNSGLPPQIESNMEELLAKEEAAAMASIDMDVWHAYAKDRPYVQPTPHMEAAAIMIRNRRAIIKDILKQASTSVGKRQQLPSSDKEADESLRALVELLLNGGDASTAEISIDMRKAECMATFLDHRICVPRDMGAMAASALKVMAISMRTEQWPK